MKPYSNKNYKFVKSVFPYPTEIPELFNLDNDIKFVKRSEGSEVTSQGTAEFNRRDDLFLCMRPFLLFGKCIGLVPISGILSGDVDKLEFSKCSVSGVLTLVVMILLTGNTGLALAGYFRTGGRDATQLAKNAAGFVCYMIGLYVFIFIFRNSQKMIDLLREWRRCEVSLRSYSFEDKHLKLTIHLIAGSILTSAVMENAVSHLLLFPLNNNEDIGNQKLEYYYRKSHPQWAEMIGYNPVIAIIVFLCNKWSVYAWNFGDIFIFICSRALYGRFKSFYEDAMTKLATEPSPFDSPKTCIGPSKLGTPKAIEDKLGPLPQQAFLKPEWLEAIAHHDELCRIHEEFAAMLSPLVFASYVVNIYFICIQLHIFLVPSPSQDFIAGIYGGWSFLHLLLRTYIVSLTAAKIHDYAHAFVNLLRKCPHHVYRIEIERAEKKLSTSTIALNGLGTFAISRPFILSVLSVIFTFEIVLLQTTTPLVQPHMSSPLNKTNLV